MSHIGIDSINELATRCNIPQSSFHRIINAGSMPSLTNAVRIADFFNVSLDNLVKGNPLEELKRPNTRLIPIISLNDANNIDVSNLNQSRWDDWVSSDCTKDPNAFAFRINYAGLEQPFTPDSVHIVDTSLIPLSNDICVLKQNNHSNVLRHIVSDGEQFIGTTLNKISTAKIIDPSLILGVITSSVTRRQQHEQ